MIVDKIRVLNFASYDRAELDFRKLGGTVFIQGSTGAGKTTFFIDTQTLALFGKAYGEESREASKWVVPTTLRGPTVIEVDFRVRGSSYRVLRMLRSRDRSWEARLVRLDEGGGEIAQVASGVRSVDAAIKELTGMDFSTYLSTVVVRQGEVSKIVGRSLQPSERREIFLKAFGVGFSRCRERARELLVETRRKLSAVEAELELLKREAQEIDILENKLGRLVAELETVERRFGKVENLRNSLTGRVKALRAHLDELTARLSTLKEKSKHLSELKSEFSRKEAEVLNLENSLSKLKPLKLEIEDLKRRRDALRDVIPALEEYWRLKGERDGLSSDLERLQGRLLKLEGLEARVRELRKLASMLGMVERERRELDEVVAKTRDLASRLHERINTLRANIATLTKTGRVTKCPVCGRPLSHVQLLDVLSHLKSELKLEENRLRGLAGKLETLESKRSELEKLYLSCKTAQEGLEDAKEILKTLKPVKEEFERASKRVKELDHLIENLRLKCTSILGDVKTLRELNEGLRLLDERLDRLGERLRELHEAGSRLSILKTDLSQLKRLISELESELRVLDSVRVERSKTSAELMRLEEELKSCEEEYSKLRERMGWLRGSIAEVKGKLERAKVAWEKARSLEKTLAELKRREQVYRILYSEVFHDRGLPLSLLREFLSSVEAWSRFYLQRFLPGKDIRIRADESGRVSIEVLDGSTVRNLSTYSGGESTLIGFAVRLGIAKAVAERALTAAPKMLVIDEGFGPLSSEFREEVLKTLRELKGDYERIIVISHVEEIRESPYFDSHVRVYRDAKGVSRIEVLN